MELLLTLTYVAICVAIFKIFRIPVNQWTLATAALGGIFGRLLELQPGVQALLHVHVVASPAAFLVEGLCMTVVIELDRRALGCAELPGKRQPDGRRPDDPGGLPVAGLRVEPFAPGDQQQSQQDRYAGEKSHLVYLSLYGSWITDRRV